jgi:crotonobetainyl-CoA:carnitine CoA-transferase CaiB-like acyl-CoA transferase
MFRGSDGRDFVVAVGTQAVWKRLLQVLELENALGGDARFATNAERIRHRDELIPVLQQHFSALPTSTWIKRLMAAEIPAAPIQTVGEALSDPQTFSRRLIVELEHPTLKFVRSIANPVRLEAQPVTYRLPPPLLGEHNRAILQELGFSAPETENALKEACSAPQSTASVT